MAETAPAPAPVDRQTFCAVHTDRETSLRCNKCGRYMCTACAVQTPIGYRCRECVRQVEDKFFTATPNDTALIVGVVGGLSALVGGIMSALPAGLFIAILIGLPLGGVISELALRVTKRRRSRYAGQIGAVAAIVGGLLGAAVQIMIVTNGRLPLNVLPQFLFRDIGVLVILGIIAFAVYGRFNMKL